MFHKNNYLLIGMPGSGKSSLGSAAASANELDYIDTDTVIESKYNNTLSGLIQIHGSDGFLNIEDEVNAGIVPERPSIISPGGSIVYCKNAMEHYAKISTIIYLRLDYKTIEDRLGDLKKRGVVLKPNQTLLSLYNERCTLYERYADVILGLEGLDMEECIDKLNKYILKENI